VATPPEWKYLTSSSGCRRAWIVFAKLVKNKAIYTPIEIIE
jgi:hypothetical protein